MKKKLILFVLLLVLLSVALQLGYSQQTDPLEKSLYLINDTISLLQIIQTDNSKLQQELMTLSAELEVLRQSSQEQEQLQKQQLQIYNKQLNVLNKQLSKGKRLRLSLIISLPICTTLGVWLGYSLTK